MPLLSKLKNIKKRWLLLSITLLLALPAIILFARSDSDRRFSKLADKIFINEMLANTLNMHYTLAYPEDFGIAKYDVILPCYTSANSAATTDTLANYLTDLSRIDASKLSADNAYTYRLLYSSLEDSLNGQKFLYYNEPLSPSSGMQSQLPILLAEYTFRTEQDIKDYLTLLDQTDEYFAALATFQSEKKEAGLLQADSSLQKVITQCDTILSATELKEGNHFLQLTFAERLHPLIAENKLSEERADYYISLNDRLLSTVMQPAYDSLADSLFLLMDDGTSHPRGLGALPLGQEYYLHLLSQNTGSDLTIEEIKNLLYPTFQAEYTKLQSLLLQKTDSASFLSAADEVAVFPFTAPTDILSDLIFRMEQDFPSLPTDSHKDLPLPTVKTVSDSLAAYSAPAFYLTPPLDDPLTNVIYINPLTTYEGLDLYTTLAHEGYPGHLYQSVYSLTNRQLQNTHPVRQILWYGGYQEGWALYVEFLSYDYAIDLAKEQSQSESALSYEIEKHNRNMQLCLYSLLDIAIHYDNTSYEDIHQLLSSFGIQNPDTTRAVYDYIAEEPTNYLKYYLGYLEILSLKERAKSLWQEEYSDYRFHQFLLDCGPSDFSTLEITLS